MRVEPEKRTVVRPHWAERIGAITAGISGLPRVLLASDFDGTLAPIVDRPEEASLPAATLEVLDQFAGLHPKVELAFLSGRELGDLRSRIRLPEKVVFAGNHGLEIRSDGRTWIHPEVQAMRPVLDKLLVDLEEAFGEIPGLEIEDKGLSLTLHYRRVFPGSLTLLCSSIEAFPLPKGIRRHGGKMVFEFRPEVAWNKGKAIRQIATGLGIGLDAVIFLGDDLTDEDVFRILPCEAPTVHVGAEDKPSLARFNAENPADAAGFLEALLPVLRG